jgi:hypothetical protein
VPIAGAVGDALDRASPRGRRMLAVLDRWRTLVSPKTLEHARPTSIRRDVLAITVTDSLWMSELTYFVPRFLEALNRSLPADARLASIRLRVGSLPPRRDRPRDDEARPVDTASLPVETRRRIERISDPALREQMARIAARLAGPKRGP